MDSLVHFLDLENRNLDHLVRQSVDNCLEFLRICKNMCKYLLLFRLSKKEFEDVAINRTISVNL